MNTNSYSQKIAGIIDDHLTARDLVYSFREDRGAFDFIFRVPGKVNMLHYMILIHPDSFTVTVRYPLGVSSDDNMIVTMAKFLTRVNYGLRMGNFEMDLDRGQIHYKVHCNCADIQPSEAMIDESIHCPIAMFKKYEPGIMGILFEDMSDEAAENVCEEATLETVGRLEELHDQPKTLLDSLISEDDKSEDMSDELYEKAPTDSFVDFLKMLSDTVAEDSGFLEESDNRDTELELLSEDTLA